MSSIAPGAPESIREKVWPGRTALTTHWSSGAVPTLFTSGYTRDEIVHHGKLDAGITLLSKPYRRDDLARKVRSVLRASAGPVAGATHVGKMTDREIAACVPPVAYDPSSVDTPGVDTPGVDTPGA